MEDQFISLEAFQANHVLPWEFVLDEAEKKNIQLDNYRIKSIKKRNLYFEILYVLISNPDESFVVELTTDNDGKVSWGSSFEYLEVSPETLLSRIEVYQRESHFHPLTCGFKSSHELLKPQIVENEVRLYCTDCGYEQKYIPNIFKSKRYDEGVEERRSVLRRFKNL